MPFIHSTPEFNPELTKQEELTAVDDATFKAGYTPRDSTWFDRLVQVFFFVTGLGFIRMIIGVVSTILYIVCMLPLVAFYNKQWFLDLFLQPYIWFTNKYIRLLNWFFSIWWIDVKGTPDPKARVLAYNHQTVLDGPMVFSLYPFTIVGAAGIGQLPVFGKLVASTNCIYVDRRSREGNTGKILKVIRDPTRRPIALAPEAKTENGNYIFKFRTGGFVEPTTVQPITIRYTNYFAFGKLTSSWVVNTFLEWAWFAFCIPFTKCEVTFLEPITKEEMELLSIEERAKKCQLAIANNLGTLAIDRTSKELFKAKAE